MKIIDNMKAKLSRKKNIDSDTLDSLVGTNSTEAERTIPLRYLLICKAEKESAERYLVVGIGIGIGKLHVDSPPVIDENNAGALGSAIARYTICKGGTKTEKARREREIIGIMENGMSFSVSPNLSQALERVLSSYHHFSSLTKKERGELEWCMEAQSKMLTERIANAGKMNYSSW